MKTSSQDVLITKNGLYTNDNQQENDINTVIAETADSNIKNLSDPNLMSVIEKQYNIAQLAGLTSQYNVLVQNAKDEGINTTAVTTAYNNLNKFMANVLTDPDHASDVDRVTYKKYQDAYNQELANLQNALQNNANSKFTSAASATSQAASTASQAFSQANSAAGVANSATAEITKLSGDINLRVTKGDLISQINMQAGYTLISSSGQLTLSGKNIYFDTANPVIIPSANIDTLLVNKQLTAADISANTFSTNNETFTVDKDGAITAKNMTINGGTLTSPTINGSTINTPTLNLGLNGQFTESYDYTQDTSWFLPKKASGDVTFNHGVIEDQGTMQSYVNGTWGAINDSSVFTSGITNNVWTEYAPGYYKIDMYKQGSTTNVLQRTYADPTGYYYTSASGDNSYLGNVLQTPQVQTAGVFTQYIGPGKGALRLQIGQNGKDYGLQVGSYAGKEAVLSDFIYNSTTSCSPNVHIDIYGRLVRTTSASKYKYNIKNPDIEDTLGDRLLNVHLATWNDKRAVDSYAEQLSTGEEREKTSIDKYYGLIAEQLRDAGLDMFISYGKNHEIEGIQYDRAWLPLLPKMRQMNDKINEYELRISKLEAKINE